MKLELTGKLAERNFGWNDAKPPLLRFLTDCHTEFSAENSGAVADYIPELNKADPNHFGIGLTTLDGHVYDIGDTPTPFTIPSLSHTFAFPLPLDSSAAAP